MGVRSGRMWTTIATTKKRKMTRIPSVSRVVYRPRVPFDEQAVSENAPSEIARCSDARTLAVGGCDGHYSPVEVERCDYPFSSGVYEPVVEYSTRRQGGAN